MKKTFDVERIASELTGKSAFFREPPPLPAAIPTAAPQTPQTRPAEPVVTYSHATAVETPPAVSTVDVPVTQGANIPERPNGRTPERATDRTDERPDERSPGRPNARPDERTDARTPERRSIIRHSFEFYSDQIETLKKVSLEAKMRGEKGSMSEMIRDAVDMYIERHRPSETTATRTPERTNG